MQTLGSHETTSGTKGRREGPVVGPAATALMSFYHHLPSKNNRRYRISLNARRNSPVAAGRPGMTVTLLVLSLVFSAAQLSAAERGDSRGNPAGSIRNDPNLLVNLYARKFEAISDEAWSRLNQFAVLKGFTDAGCKLDGRTSPLEASQAILNMGYFVGDRNYKYRPESMNAVYLNAAPLYPNYQSAVAAAAADHCGERTQKILANLIEMINRRTSGEEPPRGPSPLRKQTILPVDQIAPPSITNIPTITTREAVIQQIRDLARSGHQFMICDYETPDVTPLTYRFWYREVPVSKGQLMQLARMHPLAALGDLPLTQCPAASDEARTRSAESQHRAQQGIDPAALPAARIPLQMVMGANMAVFRSAQTDWAEYKSSGQERFRSSALARKQQLITDYAKACEKMTRATGKADNMYCQIDSQLKQDLAEIH
jgi:hypothetical protein